MEPIPVIDRVGTNEDENHDPAQPAALKDNVVSSQFLQAILVK